MSITILSVAESALSVERAAAACSGLCDSVPTAAAARRSVQIYFLLAHARVQRQRYFRYSPKPAAEWS